MRTYLSTPLAAALVAAGLLAGAACQTDSNARRPDGDEANSEHPDPGDLAELPPEPEGAANSSFWDHWGDGRAELASYRGELVRYGEPREAHVVLIFVTEPHDRNRWIKDDDAEGADRVEVLKLNRSMKFQTGIYPYAVMTSVFSPVADWGRRRFQPTKIAMNSQEWCGNVSHVVWPGPERFLRDLQTYFAAEQEGRRTVSTPGDTLYQDALPIQLRELDGAFNDGEDWSGHLVPSIWHSRRAHEPLEPVKATIERSSTTVDGREATRFVLEYGDTKVTYDIAREYPHRLLQWRHSDGSHLELVEAVRKPYWRQNRPGDESHRKSLGLPPRAFNFPDRRNGESSAPTEADDTSDDTADAGESSD